MDDYTRYKNYMNYWTTHGSKLTKLDSSLMPQEWVIDNLVKTDFYILESKPKTGKTTIGLEMCLAVFKGEKFLGQKTAKCSAIFLSMEDTKQQIVRRLEILEPKYGGIASGYVRFCGKSSPSVDIEDNIVTRLSYLCNTYTEGALVNIYTQDFFYRPRLPIDDVIQWMQLELCSGNWNPAKLFGRPVKLIVLDGRFPCTDADILKYQKFSEKFEVAVVLTRNNRVDLTASEVSNQLPCNYLHLVKGKEGLDLIPSNTPKFYY